MRVARRAGLVFGELAGLGVEFADVALEVPRVPDVAILIHREAMRPGDRRLGVIFGDFVGLRIEMADQATHMAGIPEGSIRRRQRIMRPTSGSGQHPFLDTDLHRTGHLFEWREWFFRETLNP